jgi:hypothetical protein
MPARRIPSTAWLSCVFGAASGRPPGSAKRTVVQTQMLAAARCCKGVSGVPLREFSQRGREGEVRGPEVVGALNAEAVPGDVLPSREGRRRYSLAIENDTELAYVLAVVTACTSLLNTIRDVQSSRRRTQAQSSSRNSCRSRNCRTRLLHACKRTYGQPSLLLGKKCTHRSRRRPVRGSCARRGAGACTSAPRAPVPLMVLQHSVDCARSIRTLLPFPSVSGSTAHGFRVLCYASASIRHDAAG